MFSGAVPAMPAILRAISGCCLIISMICAFIALSFGWPSR